MIYGRQGVELDRSALAGLVGATSELLSPLVDAVRAVTFRAQRKLYADGTPVPALAPGNGRRRPAGSGHRCAMITRQARTPGPPYSLPSRQIRRANIPAST